MNLHQYDLVIINSSGGKDSLGAIWRICKMADRQGYDKSKIVISHQDLGRMEWPGTKELVQKQADHFGLFAYYSKRRDHNGVEGSLLEYVERRGKWMDGQNRFCTSDFKRGPGMRVLVKLTKDMKSSAILYVFGFRADESPSRKKKEIFKVHIKGTTRHRKVYEYLPIHTWSKERIWKVIKSNNLPYHPAYDLGMPRLSCIFCFYSPFDALVKAGKANPELLKEYVAVEQKIQHKFTQKHSIEDVQKAIANNYQPGQIDDWVM